MDVWSIEVFVEGVDLGGFAQVAKNRGVTATKISRSVSYLEKELKVKLLNRSTRNVSPTQAGKLFYQEILPSIHCINSARSKLTEEKNALSGLLRITVPTSYFQIKLTPVIQKFCQKYPDIRLEVVCTDQVLNLYDGLVDIAIRLGRLKDSSLIGVCLTDMKYICCVSPMYVQKYGMPQTPEELQDHNCLFFPAPDDRSKWTFKDKTGQATVVDVHGRTLVTDTSSLVSFAVNGAGILLSPDWAVDDELKSGRLEVILRDYVATSTEFDLGVWCVYTSRDYMTEKVQVFVNFMKEELRV